MRTLPYAFARAVEVALRSGVPDDGYRLPADLAELPERAAKYLEHGDLELIGRHADDLLLLRPGVTWAICDRCGESRLSADARPVGCDMTVGCDGLLVPINRNLAAKLRSAQNLGGS